MECAMVSFSGGGLKFWLEAYSTSTQTNVSFTPIVADANVSAVIKPKGTGALLASIPDGTTVGGNARGSYAVDLQMSRVAATQVASGNYSVIAGGSNNTSSSPYSVVVNGNSNIAAGYYNFIGGGFTNSGTANAAVTTQSTTTTSGSTAATLSGANANIKIGQYITGTGIASDTYVANISGTTLTLSKNATASATNTLSFFTPHGVVVGGGNNQATGMYSFIGGGGDAGNTANRNTASGDWSVVTGGWKNIAPANFSGVGSGENNNANGKWSFIGGGLSNSCPSGSQSYLFLGGGQGNQVRNDYGVICGGFANICGQGGGYLHGVSFVGGGESNYVYANNGSLVGGSSNLVSGGYAAITGGRSNTSSGSYSSVGGGQTNTASGSHSSVIGGQSNTASGSHSSVIAGQGNTISGARGAVGGNGSTNSGSECFVFGISCSSNAEATVAMGRNCTANGIGQRGMVAMGNNCSATTEGGVAIGSSCGSTNFYAVALGASGASGDSSFAAGRSTASGANSFAVGRETVSNLHGQFSHSSGGFTAYGDAQAHELVWRRAVTGNSITELFLDGASVAAILPGTNCLWQGTIDIAAICTVVGNGTTTLGDAQGTTYKVTIKRLGTATTLVGSVQEIGTMNADPSALGGFTIDANNTNESLRIQYTPPATAGSTTVHRVVATFKGLQIQF